MCDSFLFPVSLSSPSLDHKDLAIPCMPSLRRLTCDCSRSSSLPPITTRRGDGDGINITFCRPFLLSASWSESHSKARMRRRRRDRERQDPRFWCASVCASPTPTRR